MNRTVIAVLVVIAVAGSVVCAMRRERLSSPKQPPTAAEPVVGTGPERPNGNGDDLGQLVAGNTAFAFDLYHELRKGDGNLFFSPYSISVALAMTYAGARGNTEKQMAKALHFQLSQQRLHPAFHTLRVELASRREHWRENEFELHVADAIWPQKGFELLPSFIQVLKANYETEVTQLDFAGNPEGSRTAINDWARDHTKGKIRDLVPAGLITPAVVLVLTDAIYFKALWDHPFDPESTRPGPFRLLDGNEVEADMMSMEWGYMYGEDRDHQALQMPYLMDMSLIVLLPRQGHFASFERSLDAEKVKAIIAGLKARQVRLSVPKFKYESAFRLKVPLMALGMVDAFGPADFSGISDGGLFISDVVHKARVGVDEKGTEAAAATAVMLLGALGTEGAPVEMKIDRPFIFLIRDMATGVILFLGRVMDPRG